MNVGFLAFSIVLVCIVDLALSRPVAILNLAGPLTGLLIQPIIGAMVIRLGKIWRWQNLIFLGHFYVASLYFFPFQ
jgi:hypothetical protein